MYLNRVPTRGAKPTGRPPLPVEVHSGTSAGFRAVERPGHGIPDTLLSERHVATFSATLTAGINVLVPSNVGAAQ